MTDTMSEDKSSRWTVDILVSMGMVDSIIDDLTKEPSITSLRKNAERYRRIYKDRLLEWKEKK